MQPEIDRSPAPAGGTRFDRAYRWIALTVMAVLVIAGVIYVALQ